MTQLTGVTESTVVDAKARRAAAQADARQHLDAAAGALATSRAAAVRAIAAAENAMLSALRAVEEHSAVVRSTAADMKARGLVHRDADGDHELGVVSADLLRLRGEWWRVVPPAALNARLFARVAQSAFGAPLPPMPGGLPADFVERLPDLPAADLKPLPRIVQAECQPLVGMSAGARDAELRHRAVQWTVGR